MAHEGKLLLLSSSVEGKRKKKCMESFGRKISKVTYDLLELHSPGECLEKAVYLLVHFRDVTSTGGRFSSVTYESVHLRTGVCYMSCNILLHDIVS
jgi:hypothetical protein